MRNVSHSDGFADRTPCFIANSRVRTLSQIGHTTEHAVSDTAKTGSSCSNLYYPPALHRHIHLHTRPWQRDFQGQQSAIGGDVDITPGGKYSLFASWLEYRRPIALRALEDELGLVDNVELQPEPRRCPAGLQA